jgi:hypothetical protein
MQPSLNQELGMHLTTDLAGATTLDNVQDWLVGATWTIDDTGDEAVSAIVYEVKLALAEKSSGFISESELREALASLLYRNHANGPA